MRTSPPKVFIATPSHDHKFHASFAYSLLRLQAAQLYPLYLSKVGGAGVARARNNQAHEFLEKTTCDFFFPIDADIEFQPEHVARLVEAQVDNVGGYYPLKQTELAWCVQGLPGEAMDPQTGLQRVAYTGTGFKCIHRSVFERIRAAHPEIAYKDDLGDARGVTRWDFFSMGVVNGRYLSEDWYFDHRCAGLGIPVHVDCTFYVKHEGLISFPLKDPMAKEPRWPAEYLAAGIAPDHCADVLDGAYEVAFDPPTPPVILDIGANIGAFASWASVRWPGCDLHCYEPDPKNFRLLEKTAACIRAESKSLIECYPFAVLDHAGVLPLRRGLHNCGEHSLYDLGEQSADTVQVDVIAAHAMPSAEILKIDAEGSELPILKALDREGRLGQFSAVVLEYHRAADYPAIVELLTARGHALVHHNPRCADRGEMAFMLCPPVDTQR